MLPQSAQSSKSIRKGFLRRRSDYLKTYKGRIVRKELFVLYACKGDSPQHRFGVTAPKTIGSAVVRNKFKRWGKELYRATPLDDLHEPTDINVFVGNRRLKKEVFKDVPFTEFKKQFQESLQSLVRNTK